jgi:hypothetical protein
MKQAGAIVRRCNNESKDDGPWISWTLNLKLGSYKNFGFGYSLGVFWYVWYEMPRHLYKLNSKETDLERRVFRKVYFRKMSTNLEPLVFRTVPREQRSLARVRMQTCPNVLRCTCNGKGPDADMP